MSEQQKKQPTSLPEMHRAAHAARNMTEQRFDTLIANAKSVDKAKELTASRDGFILTYDAFLRVLDVLVEFPDDFRPFYRDLLAKRKLKIEQEKTARKGSSAVDDLRMGRA